MKAFGQGFTSVFGFFGGRVEDWRNSFQRNDREALANDWKKVGEDMQKAMPLPPKKKP